MNSAEIRQKFLDFFASKGHTVVASSSLVPGNDPTLLFTNSGMVQFKDVFTGKDKRPYTRATSSQRSLRAGGKHNDLENVGYTARHHTFFEMLGNFSFGDYFKRDAIHYAWELLTQVYRLPTEKLWVTVYAEDDEAYDIWAREVGVPVERIVRIGDNKGARYASDNFWQMADTGPCGPCSEIFYDHGAEIPGGPPGSPDEDGDRYIEIWNLVFMQFNRDEAGVLHPLPKPSVDTGMGLERIAAVLQHVHSNYEIDLFQQLIKAAARETHCRDLANNSLKVIADHIRACAFMVLDGIIPGADGRGYVLRRIIRRAIRHGYKLGQKQPFFHKLVDDLCKAMGEAYPDLAEQHARITAVLRQEEERFGETIEHGMEILEAALTVEPGLKTLDGETAFKLYDTHGFPLDLTADICRERGMSIDEAGFNAAMERQREMARAASSFKMKGSVEYDGKSTDFKGYESLEEEATVLALYRDSQRVNQFNAGDEGIVVLDATPFYAESGGQVGDCGELVRGAVCTTLFEVRDTQKIQADVFGHQGTLKAGTLAVGEKVTARVNTAARMRAQWNHSATHLLHAALREVLGKHVQQKGSLVDAQRTRFDFSHPQQMTAQEIARVEALVNREIRRNVEVSARHMGYDDAIASGAMALFGEKYGDEVRVIGMGEFSTELCGGTHVRRTGDIGLFKIISEGGVAAGIRRVEAVTGEGALEYIQQLDGQLADIAAQVKAPAQEAAARIASLLEGTRALEKELARLKSKLAATQGDDLAGQAIELKGSKVLAATLEGADAKALRETLDQLRNKLGSAAIVLGSVADGKVTLIAGVTNDLHAKLKAGELVNAVAQQVGGKGGGRADMAQAGGTQPENLGAALASVKGWVEQRL
ncbi:alanyl-tRNA synthetase [Sterolibacterium denitrificans]|uniref:Alanine--tRNA ligase n=1 Tax=Sterolibacterium denitrificans TaxID=157592 RepID=A0A7Z7MVE4_9PROT|nr:alanine--tRNA ligase [Sterolibacterium denitrificans]SMB26757.1 alanyl-tRNA synthetase [Sterolibacterium denitrificans]